MIFSALTNLTTFRPNGRERAGKHVGLNPVDIRLYGWSEDLKLPAPARVYLRRQP